MIFFKLTSTEAFSCATKYHSDFHKLSYLPRNKLKPVTKITNAAFAVIEGVIEHLSLSEEGHQANTSRATICIE